MTETLRWIALKQFDVGSVRRFRLFVAGAVLPTAGLNCQFRMQRVDVNGDPVGSPITANCSAVSGDWWEYTVAAPMTATAGDYQVEARIDNGSGEIRRFPTAEKASITVVPVQTGGSA